MPTARNGSVSLHYETDGEGETVAFVEDAGYGAWMWGWQHGALAGPYETLVWDSRGTGRSDAPAGPYTVESMAADLEAVLADAGVRKAHVVGAGLGGMVALRYALDYNRAATLTLVGASPGGARAKPTPESVRERLLADPADRAALRESLGAVASDELLETDDLVDQILDWRAAEDADPAALRAQWAAVEEFDVSDRLYEITVPALVVHGTGDEVVPVENGRLLADGLPKGELLELDAPHLVFVERSRDVNDAIVGFLESQVDS